MNLAWRLLVGAGLLLVVYALSLDTTVDVSYGKRVHNVGLQQDRLLLLVFGCALLLGGIGLFGVHKLKQTPEQEQEQARKRKELLSSIGKKVDAKLVEWESKNPIGGTSAPTTQPKGAKQVELKGDIGDFSRRAQSRPMESKKSTED